MLNFMYLFDYGTSGSDRARVSPMIFHVKVYSIADKYDVVALKSQAKEKFEKAARSCWNMEDFPPAISEVYSLTPATDRGLRDLVVEIVCTHIDALLVRQDFRNVLEETVGFAADVTQLIASTSTLKEYKCPHCSNRWKAMLSGGSTYYCVRCGSSRANWEQHVVTES
jgi:speckle-type POZ protein